MATSAADLDEARFTPRQRDAIVARGGDLLVSAAAGSGKTSVLVERVIQRLLDRERPTAVDRVLVVTFTEAAAAEMRSRISKRLEQVLLDHPDDRAVREQLALLPRASISTIHSFCLRLVREHFHHLGLDPSVAILDEHESRLMLAESLEAVFHDRHAAEEQGFLALVRSYGGGEAPVAVKALVVSLFRYTRSLARPEAWLDAAARRFTETAGAGGIAATPYFEPLRRAVEVELARYEAELAALAVAAVRPGGPAVYVKRLEADAAALATASAAVAAAASFAALVEALAAISFGSLSPAKGELDEALKKWIQGRRNTIKNKVNGLTARLAGPEESDWLADLGRLAPHAAALAALVRDLDHRYAALKRRRAALDFDDLEHFALALLGRVDEASGRLAPTAVARELAARFEEVLVDEYQDVNGVQEAILSLVSRDAAAPGAGNRFVVGDVKQSIYGFRHTDPSLFLARLARYQADPAVGRAIVLAQNFRSRRAVVDAVNFVFRQVMSEEVGGIAYRDDAELVYGADYPDAPADAHADAPVELHLVERSEALLASDDDGDGGGSGGEASEPGAADAPARSELAAWLDDAVAAEREALVAANRVRAIVQGDPASGAPPARVWERHGAGGAWESRPAAWRDVVVLLRSIKNRAPAYVQVFGAFGIPIHAEVGTGWFAVTEIGVMLALLQVLDNPRQDIPLAAVLISPLGGFRAADLARMRLADRHGDFWDAVRAAAADDSSHLEPAVRARLAALLARIDEWRTAARRGALSRLVWRIYGETRFLDVVSAMPGGEQRRANLLALFDRAREFDHFARQGLARFLGFIAKLEERDEDLGTAPVLGAGDDVVRVMSIHKSKGLEFPFVVLAGLGTEWNDRDLEGDVLFDGALGLGLRVVDLELRARFPSLAHHAVKAARAAAMRAEELRVLYVALTRARERLVLIGSARGLANECVRWVASGLRAGERLAPALVAAACRPLDWLVPAVARHPDASVLRAAAGLEGGRVTDPSRWDVRLWTRAELDAGAPRRSVTTVARGLPDWPALAALEPSVLRAHASEPAEADRAELSARFAWTYPYSAATAHFAKLSVTELKSRFAAGAPADPDAAEVEAARITWPVRGAPRGSRRGRAKAPVKGSGAAPHALDAWERPRFLESGVPRAPGAAEAGIATHLVLRHLDARVWHEADAVRAAVAVMVAQGRVSAEQAAAARLDAIVAFGRSPLGVRLAARPEALRREVPFTLGLPAHEVHAEIPAGDGAGDVIVVQGVIDLLMEVEDGGGFLVLDYKTDRVPPAEVAAAAERYRGQMALYGRAVSDTFGRPVVESWLGFLSAGVAVQLPT
jgi:ATP-dependent helicase/nuclease subunit A